MPLESKHNTRTNGRCTTRSDGEGGAHAKPLSHKEEENQEAEEEASSARGSTVFAAWRDTSFARHRALANCFLVPPTRNRRAANGGGGSARCGGSRGERRGAELAVAFDKEQRIGASGTES